MMKTYTVQSTRKNPDKYINILKQQLDRARDMRDMYMNDLRALRGRRLFTPARTTRHEKEAAGHVFRDLRLNDIIHIVCRVTRVKQYFECSAARSSVELTEVETRKVEE
jgi:hypothetical protein